MKRVGGSESLYLLQLASMEFPRVGMSSLKLLEAHIPVLSDWIKSSTSDLLWQAEVKLAASLQYHCFIFTLNLTDTHLR